MKNKSEKFLEAVGDNDWSVILEPGSVHSYLDLSHLDMDALMEFAVENNVRFVAATPGDIKKLIQTSGFEHSVLPSKMEWQGVDLDKKNNLVILSSIEDGEESGSELYCTKIKVVR